MLDQQFLKSVQDFIANSFSISIIRRMGPGGTLDCIRTFLKKVDFAAISKKEPSQYAQTLDELTENLRRTMPKGADGWGVARKCLNLFFRDCLYNFYLREAYDLEKFERYLEIPLDSYVGRELRREDGRLPRWHTVKGLTREESAKFQEVASEIANRKKTNRVHLDVVYWRGEQNSK